ncbi:cellulose synthase operon protein YhjQ/BcsQ [Paraferrimonas sp. SM1919]|uniref:cellulose synthase operon protein YhjQ/BcsQ n=1 Tax=Paraferrimonas sp. SM1919 TaxID=2662263 RepID=UPI0013D14EDB|nr:cellulose synthase operon protein YhjQ/BcsQ [Paraferrimonas sp. SM1919]
MAILSVSGVQSGVGGNTIAANLAATFCELGHKTIVVDASLKNLVGHWFGLRHDQQGWSEKMDLQSAWQQVIFKDNQGTFYIPYGNKAQSQDAIKNALTLMLSELKLKFDIIIVNLDCELARAQQLDFDLHLKVLMPTPASVLLLNQFLIRENYPNQYLYVLNQCRHDIALNRDMTLLIQQILDKKLLNSAIYYDIALQEAFAQMQNLVTGAPLSHAKIEFSQLAQECLQHCQLSPIVKRVKGL